jgi:2-polyprenyl-3-methyl-5-hydroxy-6-metoxy-1,4-benzoquinol methylase
LTSIPSSSISPPDSAECGIEGVSAHQPGTRIADLDLSQRAVLTEWMDLPCSYEELRSCLHDIAVVNRLTFAHRPTLAWLEQVVAAKAASARALRVVDVGCGYGDTLRMIESWAGRRGIAVELTGVDLNPDAIRTAREATPSGQRIEWLVGDALDGTTTGDVDVVISSLLTHHLSDSQIVRFLSWMESTARCGWFINDLHRQIVPYHFFRIVARFTRWHPFVKHDGPVSILRSFSPENWRQLCATAGLDAEEICIREYRPARLCVGRIR